jgi:hypothetical protein
MSLDPTITESTPAPETFQPPSRRRSVTLVNVALGLALAVAVGGVAFAAGRATAPAATRGAFANGQFPTGSQAPGVLGGAGGLGGRAGLSIEGSVVSVDADSMTIETAAGTTIDVAVDGSTTYHQQADAAASAVTTGSDVIVRLTGAARGPGAAASGEPTGIASDVTIVP